jgi:uncharacterized DUF497 family protein
MGVLTRRGQRFSWDDDKRRLVRRTHGIDLVDACRVFDHDVLEEYDDAHSASEDRWRGIGLLDDRFVFVAYTYRGDTIRLITVRPAEPDEEKAYVAHFLGERS